MRARRGSIGRPPAAGAGHAASGRSRAGGRRRRGVLRPGRRTGGRLRRGASRSGRCRSRRSRTGRRSRRRRGASRRRGGLRSLGRRRPGSARRHAPARARGGGGRLRNLDQRLAVEARGGRVCILRREFVDAHVFVGKFQQYLELDGHQVVAAYATRPARGDDRFHAGELLGSERILCRREHVFCLLHRFRSWRVPPGPARGRGRRRASPVAVTSSTAAATGQREDDLVIWKFIRHRFGPFCSFMRHQLYRSSNGFCLLPAARKRGAAGPPERTVR